MTYAFCHYFKLYGPCRDVFEAEHKMYLRWKTLRADVLGAPEDMGIFEYWTVMPQFVVARITPIRTNGWLSPDRLVSGISEAYPNVVFEYGSIQDDDRLHCHLFKDGDPVARYGRRISLAQSRSCNEYFYSDAVNLDEAASKFRPDAKRGCDPAAEA
jgi:hypothetical protein